MRSPTSRLPLRADTAHTLTDGVERWPVVDGIPWLRAGKPELQARTVAALDRGNLPHARRLLLGDADDWWTEPPPAPAQLDAAVDAGSLREAMARLGLGRVGDYFAYRWSDPTYLSGLALLQQHWPGHRPVLEVACGVGHFLRELALRGVADVTGLDVVFAKLWLARRFVATSARLVCCDVELPWPLDCPGSPAYVLCHDALYFFRDKPAVVASMAAYAGAPGGSVVVGHAHNALADPLSAGKPLPPEEWRELLGANTLMYDDAELAEALIAGRPAAPRSPDGLTSSEALALVSGDPGDPAPVDLALPVPGRPLRANPLYDERGELRWPSERYAQEYAGTSWYLPPRLPRDLPRAQAARHRLLLDLPERW